MAPFLYVYNKIEQREMSQFFNKYVYFYRFLLPCLAVQNIAFDLTSLSDESSLRMVAVVR